MDTPTPSPPDFDVEPVTIEDEMRRSYLDYAMSVIVARALPDVRDGLKPVHRRILYGMKEQGNDWNRAYRKCARICGDVMGKYHPHGNQAIYDALVRMAQDFSMRLPLVDGQGNFGSMDGDPAAADRYTEARLTRVSSDGLLEDIDKDTVEFQANYDETLQEPSVLPARFPNLLVNGAGGIAVGMATNIPTHNLGEVIDACCAYVDNPAISVDELIDIVPGPDFPTGGIILGRAGIREAYHKGRGSVMIRGKVTIEELPRERSAIVVTEIPYQVNKARLAARIGELAREKTIEGISDIRDESNREGVRLVIEVRREAMPEIVLNQLYRYTPLQTSFGINMLAIDNGRPGMMTLKEIIVAFVRFREEVITRRTIFELDKARERAHILAGLAIAVANIDEVIRLIRAAPDPNAAREALLARAWPAEQVADLIALIDEPGHKVAEDGTYRLSEAQARAILDLRLQRLTGLEREKIAEELKELAARIVDLLEILGSRARLLEVLRGELVEIKERFGDPRRTTIEEIEFEHDVEDLIQREDMVVTVTHNGYIKRVPLSTYRAQRRGGKGRAGMSTRDGDFVSRVFVCSTHTPVLFFSSRGMAYKLKVYKLPVASPQARGRPMVNLLPLQEGETITTTMAMPEDEDTWDAFFVMFATSAGTVRRNRLSDFVRVQANGKIAMKLEEGARLVSVQTCNEDQDVLLATAAGKCVRFPMEDVRLFAGRTSAGVRGIKLAEGDHVISMSILDHVEVETEERDAYFLRDRPEDQLSEAALATKRSLDPARAEELASREQFILAIAEDGLGKRSSAYEYRITARGGKGIDNLDLSRGRKGGDSRVVAAFPVAQEDQIMLVSDGGQIIRVGVEDISLQRRATRGVRIFHVAEEERVVSVTRLEEENGQEDNGQEYDGRDDEAEPEPEEGAS
ncbi:MAG: DNA gyrase subunit A [Kiloniellales bacterium]|nr:DNA gyrase subunit A [Kiloniellales bacterium]